MTGFSRDTLVHAAVAARQHAYAPYSKYLIGAAIADAAGRIFCGCNIENRSYGLTLCAERVAIAVAVAAGSREFHALAVAAAGYVTPCGACRQVLAEFCPDLTIYLVDVARPGDPIATTLARLLPEPFQLPDRA